jgi:cell division protein FtsW
MKDVAHERGHYDRVLLAAVLVLVATSVVMVYSSSSVVALTAYDDPAYFMKRQILWLLIGLAVMAVAMRINHELFGGRRMVAALLAVCLVLLVLALLPGIGRTVNGARRWIRLAGFTIQPAELVKVALVVYVSSYVSRKKEHLREFGNGLVPLFVVTGLFLGMIMLQPDFGAVVTMAVVLFIMLFAGGANTLHLAGVTLAALPLVYFAVAHKAYRLRRIFAYLNPWDDPQGAGHQIIQSFLAFGSGGIFGRGLGEGRQKLLFLPERHSDFIFAVIGEELGLIGAAAVLVLFCVILWRGVRITLAAPEGFGRMLALGITLLICVQALINMAVVTGLLPTKGIALPLVSYGGSAMVVTLGAVGVLLNISKEA